MNDVLSGLAAQGWQLYLTLQSGIQALQQPQAINTISFFLLHSLPLLYTIPKYLVDRLYIIICARPRLLLHLGVSPGLPIMDP